MRVPDGEGMGMVNVFPSFFFGKQTVSLRLVCKVKRLACFCLIPASGRVLKQQIRAPRAR